MPDDLIEEIINKKSTPTIVHADSKKINIVQKLEASFLKNFLGVGSNSNKLETYNIFDHDPDFKNRNGWSVAVSKTQLKSLKQTNIGFLMVHLTKVSDCNSLNRVWTELVFIIVHVYEIVRKLISNL